MSGSLFGCGCYDDNKRSVDDLFVEFAGNEGELGNGDRFAKF